MTFRHSHHKYETLKSDRLNAFFQFLEPKIESLRTDRLNGPLQCNWFFYRPVILISQFLIPRNQGNYQIIKGLNELDIFLPINFSVYAFKDILSNQSKLT